MQEFFASLPPENPPVDPEFQEVPVSSAVVGNQTSASATTVTPVVSAPPVPAFQYASFLRDEGKKAIVIQTILERRW
ncbi:MAG: hypothetical protein PHS41_12215 [Victivallaceae bacterium]|nr:hypothetical protein [Victivallaceae bacterium]